MTAKPVPEDKTVGSLNGSWAKLFKWVLAINAVLIPPILAWCTWTTATLWEVRYDVRHLRYTHFSVGMFVDVQDELEAKNPEVDWLSASEIKIIHERNGE